MWTIINTAQFITYQSSIKLNYPGNMMVLLDYLNYFNNATSYFPNAFDYFLVKDKLTNDAYNPQFNSIGVKTRNMLSIVGSDLQILIIVLISLFFLEIYPITNK